MRSVQSAQPSPKPHLLRSALTMPSVCKILALLLCLCLSLTTARSSILPKSHNNAKEIISTPPSVLASTTETADANPGQSNDQTDDDSNDGDTPVYTITIRNNGGITPQRLLDAISTRLGHTVDADELAKLGLIRPIEKDFFESKNSVTTDMIWRTLMPLYGIYPYPADFYRDLLPDSDYGNLYTEAHIGAILSGLIPAHQYKTNYMTPEAFDSLIEQLENGHFLTIDTPPVPLPDSLAKMTWTHDNYQYRNAVLLATYRLPEGWYADFQAQNWNLAYEPDFAKLTNVLHGDYSASKYAGLTNYSNKTIYLRQCDSLTVFHEFAHYVSWRVGWNSWQTKSQILQDCFTEEAPQVADALRDYAQTNADEYLADFVAYWMIYPELRETLITNAPKTSAHVTHLINEFTNILSH